MNTTQYLAVVAKHGDSYDNNWDILAVNKDQSLYLVKDSNHLCYVSTNDMVTTMPYGMALAEGTLAHFAGDSPIPEVIEMVVNHKMHINKIIGIDLTDDDVKWLKSDGIMSMVRSIESVS